MVQVNNWLVNAIPAALHLGPEKLDKTADLDGNVEAVTVIKVRRHCDCMPVSAQGWTKAGQLFPGVFGCF